MSRGGVRASVWKCVTTFGAVAAIASPTCAQVPITADGQAQCVIVTQPRATPAERYAAEQLADTLRQITGATIPVVKLASDPPEDSIIVGPGPVARELFPKVDLSHFGGEELAMQTSGHRLLLAGGRPRGTVYAVYRFLQEKLGVRWWTPWASTVPRHSTLSVGGLSVRETPAFEYREPYWLPAFDADWAARNGVNGTAEHLSEEQGGHIVYKGFVHTYYPQVPPDKYFNKHPEWYSLVRGKRTGVAAQLCTTNPELRDFVVERVKEWLRESPDATIVSVSQNDNGGACECPQCKAIDDREGTPEGSVLALANYVAAHIAKEYPNVAIDTLAYSYTRKPPQALRPLPNVIVRLCSIECNFAAPLTDPSNARFARDIRGWQRLTKRLYVWDYTTNFHNYQLPHPNWFSLGPNVRFYHDHGVRGVFEQGASQTSAEMGEMRAWVLAQLMWNPYQDDRKLIDEFLTGYYGEAAAPYVRRYLDLMSHAARGYYLGCFNNAARSSYLGFGTMSAAESLWQRAEGAARANPVDAWRVRQGRAAVWYAWLVRWDRLRAECERTGGTWPEPATRRELLDRWLAVVATAEPGGAPSVRCMAEGGETPATFAERLRALPEPTPRELSRMAHPLPPAGVPSRELRAAVDVQDELSRVDSEPTLAQRLLDASASDGSAVRMPGEHHQWAFQVVPDALPSRCRKGRWKLYVAIRIERAPGASPNATAFSAGFYDERTLKRGAWIERNVGQVGDGYQTYEVGIGRIDDTTVLWVGPPGNNAVKAVWVDRFFLVPAG